MIRKLVVASFAVAALGFSAARSEAHGGIRIGLSFGGRGCGSSYYAPAYYAPYYSPAYARPAYAYSPYGYGSYGYASYGYGSYGYGYGYTRPYYGYVTPPVVVYRSSPWHGRSCSRHARRDYRRRW